MRPIRDPGSALTLSIDLDRGEAEAIALMRETGADVLVLDDRRARASAKHRGLPFTGTIGILTTARKRGLIPAVVPLLEELRRRGFRIQT